MELWHFRWPLVNFEGHFVTYLLLAKLLSFLFSSRDVVGGVQKETPFVSGTWPTYAHWTPSCRHVPEESAWRRLAIARRSQRRISTCWCCRVTSCRCGRTFFQVRTNLLSHQRLSAKYCFAVICLFVCLLSMVTAVRRYDTFRIDQEWLNLGLNWSKIHNPVHLVMFCYAFVRSLRIIVFFLLCLSNYTAGGPVRLTDKRLRTYLLT